MNSAQEAPGPALRSRGSQEGASMALLTAESPVPSLVRSGCSLNVYWKNETKPPKTRSSALAITTATAWAGRGERVLGAPSRDALWRPSVPRPPSPRPQGRPAASPRPASPARTRELFPRRTSARLTEGGLRLPAGPGPRPRPHPRSRCCCSPRGAPRSWGRLLLEGHGARAGRPPPPVPGTPRRRKFPPRGGACVSTAQGRGLDGRGLRMGVAFGAWSGGTQPRLCPRRTERRWLAAR